MVASLPFYRRTLTGRVRGRRTWWNKLLLQVEVRCEKLAPYPVRDGEFPVVLGTHYTWRDATVDDMLDHTYSITPNGVERSLAVVE